MFHGAQSPCHAPNCSTVSPRRSTSRSTAAASIGQSTVDRRRSSSIWYGLSVRFARYTPSAPATSRMAAGSRTPAGRRGRHAGNASCTSTWCPCHCPECSTRGTTTVDSRAYRSAVSATVSARTSRRVSALVPSFAKPTVVPSGASNCRTGLRLARAGPMWTDTVRSRSSTRRRCSSMLSAPVTVMRSRSRARSAPVRNARAARSRLNRAERAAGCAYRRTAPAATRREPAGTSSRGLRAFGTATKWATRPPSDGGYSVASTSVRYRARSSRSFIRAPRSATAAHTRAS